MGHSVGVLALGALSLVFREVIPIDLISSWSERIVGVVLIAIGFWGLRKAFQNRVHSHAHTHDGSTHVHIHVHDKQSSHSHGEGAPHKHDHAAFAIGVLHGSAGGAHFLGVLPALAFPTLLQATAYVASYAVGTVA
ncbi:MAG TPA: nickel transporter, partial [Methylomirabilota bacterium]|nr:nickel transporter [Methylomirabilota bacterium]